jgi:limonene-1,2-epoxide hydrolase
MGTGQEEVVRTFLRHAHGPQQSADAMAEMMTDEVVWQVNVPSWKPRTGRETSRAELSRQNTLAPGCLDGSELLNIASNDRVVFTERVDVFEMMGKRITFRVNAVFEVENGKIAAWREYYDRVDLAKQLGIEPSLVVEE